MSYAQQAAHDERLRRFLAPAHAVGDRQPWHATGCADTPAADALCEIYLSVDDSSDGAVDGWRIVDTGFALYGPPVAVACADWLCEQLVGRTIADVRGLPSERMQTALALAPAERYGAMLAFDALNNAMANLKS